MNKKSFAFTLVAACAVTAFAGLRPVAAQTPVTVPDFSFEAPTTGAFQDNSGIAAGSVIPGTGNAWYYLGGAVNGGSPVGVENIAANSNSTGGLGTQNGYVNAGASMGSGSLLTLAANTTYTLTVAEARRGGGFAQTAGFSIALGYGSTAGAVPTLGASQTFTLPATVGAFSDYSVTFTTGASGGGVGQNLFVVLGSAATTGGANNPVDFDNVRVTSMAVPEPSSVVIATGAVGLLAFGYRRRRSA